MIAPEVFVSADPSPIELIFAKKIRDALEHRDYLAEAKKCVGTFGIQSVRDPQAVTIRCSTKEIRLSTGISKDCQIVLKLDLDRPEAKPAIEGLIRHPLFALKIAKFLEFPSTTWADALKRFWDQHHEKPGMPSGLTVKCLDEDRQLSVGTTESACYFEADANSLAEAFSGGTPLLQLVVKDKIRGKFSFEQAVTLNALSVKMMLGEA